MAKDQSTEDALAQIKETIEAPTGAGPILSVAASDPTTRGMDHIRTVDPDALVIWSVNGPKKVGGTVSAVLIHSSEVVMLHQLASGKYVTFRKAALEVEEE
jgi:hypothetical protein